ncbi:MAG: cytochrome c [Flavobacteriales bacterium]|nr:cytochrome c [Flavobacteriales bacterium]MBK9287053.1 cytochrome c [Flavobacteriales bacterium]
MNTKHITITAALIGSFFLAACGGGEADQLPEGVKMPESVPSSDGGPAKPGLISASDITLGAIDPAMAEKGKTTYDVKCQACHSTSANRVVGPGWKGITEKRKPEWIMNMVLNVDVMLESDPEAQKLLEECLVRMPNQNLNKEEGRQVLEFMRTL